jgi:hypothetical protein
MLTLDSGSRPIRSVLPAAALVVGAGCFAWTATHVWRFALDDTFITLRYARHLAAGLGAVYNPGEPAEGYTSPLWLLLLTLPTRLGLDPLLAAKWLGVCATLAAAGALATWPAERAGGPRAAGAVGAGLWLAVPRTALHAVSGMETGLAALCVVALFRLAADRERVIQRAWPLGLAALLAGLTRPELHLLAAVTFLALGARLDRAGRQALLVGALACWVMPMLLLESLRIEYYREHLPLPFYVKSIGAARLPGWPHVLEWWNSLARHAGVLIVPALFPLATALRVPWLATLAAMAGLAPFQPIMAPELRYLWPLAPVGYLTAGSGFERLWAWCGRVPHAAWPRAAVAAVPLLLMLHLVRLAPRTLSDDMAYAHSLERASLRLGAEMVRLAPRGLRLATSDAGVLPYLTDAWTLDLVGLNSPAVARRGERTPHDVFDRQHVSALVLVSEEPQQFRAEPWSEYEAPLASEALARGWRRVAVRRFNDAYWLWVLAPPQSTLAALPPGP